MKTLLKTSLAALAAVIILFAPGCKKDSDEESTPTVAGSWTLGANTYKVAYSNKSATSGSNPKILLIFADAAFNLPTVNTLNLSFKTAPTASGTYQLMGTVGGTLTDKQFELSAGSSAASYAYLGTAVNVEITVTNGKVKAVIPEISVKSTSGGADVKLTATVQEQ